MQLKNYFIIFCLVSASSINYAGESEVKRMLALTNNLKSPKANEKSSEKWCSSRFVSVTKAGKNCWNDDMAIVGLKKSLERDKQKDAIRSRANTY